MFFSLPNLDRSSTRFPLLNIPPSHSLPPRPSPRFSSSPPSSPNFLLLLSRTHPRVSQSSHSNRSRHPPASSSSSIPLYALTLVPEARFRRWSRSDSLGRGRSKSPTEVHLLDWRRRGWVLGERTFRVGWNREWIGGEIHARDQDWEVWRSSSCGGKEEGSSEFDRSPPPLLWLILNSNAERTLVVGLAMSQSFYAFSLSPLVAPFPPRPANATPNPLALPTSRGVKRDAPLESQGFIWGAQGTGGKKPRNEGGSVETRDETR